MCNRKKWQFCMPFSNHGCLKKTLPSSYITIPPHSNYSCLISSFWCYIIMHRHKKNRNFFMHNMSKNNKNKKLFHLFLYLYRFSPICHPAWLPNSELEKNIMGIVENILKSTKILYCYRTLFIVRTPRNLFETDKSMEKKW